MKAALLITDMLNEYLDPAGKIYCEAGRGIINNISRLRDYFRQNNAPVV